MRALKRWISYVVTPRCYPDRWQDRLFQGHVAWGSRDEDGWRIVIYGANAMHWAINVRWRSEYWCFHPTTRTFGGHWPWYFYISPDATPCTARVKFGRADY